MIGESWMSFVQHACVHGFVDLSIVASCSVVYMLWQFS